MHCGSPSPCIFIFVNSLSAAWQTADFYSVTVTVPLVPEPSRFMLLWIGWSDIYIWAKLKMLKRSLVIELPICYFERNVWNSKLDQFELVKQTYISGPPSSGMSDDSWYSAKYALVLGTSGKTKRMKRDMLLLDVKQWWLSFLSYLAFDLSLLCEISNILVDDGIKVFWEGTLH